MLSQVEEMLNEFRANPPIISEEEYREAEKRINKAMEEFDKEHRAYLAQSIESARHAYITF